MNKDPKDNRITLGNMFVPVWHWKAGVDEKTVYVSDKCGVQKRMTADDLLANYPGGDISVGQLTLKELIRDELPKEEQQVLYEWMYKELGLRIYK